MYEYFTHTTRSIKKIFDDGELNDSFTLDMDEGVHQGNYFLYMWSGLPYYPRMEWIYGSRPYILVLDTSICKLNKTYVCDSVQYGECVNDKEHRILYSNCKIPKFEPLQKHILDRIEYNIKKKRNNWAYVHSHEIVIPGKIPIEYIRAILVEKNQLKKISSTLYQMPKDLLYVINTIKEKKLNIKIIPVPKISTNIHKFFEKI
jgi:hypothetical protein